MSCNTKIVKTFENHSTSWEHYILEPFFHKNIFCFIISLKQNIPETTKPPLIHGCSQKPNKATKTTTKNSKTPLPDHG